MGLFDDIEQKVEEKKEERKPIEGSYGVRIDAVEEKASLTAGSSQEYPITLANLGKLDDVFRIRISMDYVSEEAEPAEWSVQIHGISDKAWDVTETKEMEKEIEVNNDQSKNLILKVTVPKGATYGDRLNVVLSAISKGDPGISDSRTFITTARQAMLAVKTSIGHEMAVADSIAARAKAKEVGIFSILSPATLRGYLLVESMNPDRLQEIVRGIRRARGMVKGETSFAEIGSFLTPKPLVSGIMEGDIVELISGPFKGEKARVQHIDEGKEEITVELFEAMVPIPVTVRGDSVRVLEKEET